MNGFAALDIHPHRRYVVDIGGRRSSRCRLHINFALFLRSMDFTQNLGVTHNTDGRVIACSSTETVTGEGNNSTYIGGVAGINFSQIIGCYATGSVSGNAYIGGVVGNNIASGGVVTACYHAIGAVSCTNTIPEAGGVVGRCYGKVVDCYWSGDVTLTPDSSGTYKPHGLGKTTNQINSASNVNATEVTGNDWTDAMTTMNEELSSYGWQYQSGTSGALPTLKKTNP